MPRAMRGGPFFNLTVLPAFITIHAGARSES
jgi:hypothetical protein